MAAAAFGAWLLLLCLRVRGEERSSLAVLVGESCGPPGVWAGGGEQMTGWEGLKFLLLPLVLGGAGSPVEFGQGLMDVMVPDDYSVQDLETVI